MRQTRDHTTLGRHGPGPLAQDLHYHTARGLPKAPLATTTAVHRTTLSVPGTLGERVLRDEQDCPSRLTTFRGSGESAEPHSPPSCHDPVGQKRILVDDDRLAGVSILSYRVRERDTLQLKNEMGTQATALPQYSDRTAWPRGGAIATMQSFESNSQKTVASTTCNFWYTRPLKFGSKKHVYGGA